MLTINKSRLVVLIIVDTVVQIVRPLSTVYVSICRSDTSCQQGPCETPRATRGTKSWPTRLDSLRKVYIDGMLGRKGGQWLCIGK